MGREQEVEEVKRAGQGAALDAHGCWRLWQDTSPLEVARDLTSLP